MKPQRLILSATIAAVLASMPAMLNAQPSGAGDLVSQVVRTVNDKQLFVIPKTHLPAVASSPLVAPLASTVKLNHLQLVLKPNALKMAEMEQLITNQHNPKSAQFQKWLTPQQFGAAYGLSAGDVAAATSWLTSQGFTVNNVYPNKLQIDFTGTVDQVNKAFHTTENLYTVHAAGGDTRQLANVVDISIPSALKDVVAVEQLSCPADAHEARRRQVGCQQEGIRRRESSRVSALRHSPSVFRTARCACSCRKTW